MTDVVIVDTAGDYHAEKEGQSVQAERRERELDRRANRKTTPPLSSPFSTQAVGVTHHADYPKGLNDLRGVLAQPFDDRGTVWLELRREPDNPHDSNAISVWWDGIQLGHLNKVIAFRLAAELDAGQSWLARAEEVAGDEDMPGLSIRMKREE